MDITASERIGPPRPTRPNEVPRPTTAVATLSGVPEHHFVRQFVDVVSPTWISGYSHISHRENDVDKKAASAVRIGVVVTLGRSRPTDEV